MQPLTTLFLSFKAIAERQANAGRLQTSRGRSSNIVPYLLCSIVTMAFAFFTLPIALAEEQLALIPNNNVSTDVYPHISALENAILGQSFPAQPITERMERMEKKAFGNVSTNPDLSARTDALDDYTDKQLHKKLLQANADEEQPDSTPNSTTEQPAQSQAEYPHITGLEQAILGQTFAGQPLTDRLSRMETTAFGSASLNPDLSARTDALETYAEKKLHKQPSSQPDTDTDTATANPQQGGIFAKVGQALLGMAGGGMGGPGFGGMGGGLGGSGMGLGGMGGGGMRRRQGMQQQQQQQEPPAPKQEDPAIYQATPPDPSARLLVKVAWCEVKVFGHTFPDMHLPQRLGQLNHELNLEPGKSNVQLMDDIGLMIKTVQARKLPVVLNQP
jgi:hypothetical protein